MESYVGCYLPGRVDRMTGGLKVQGFQTKFIIFLTRPALAPDSVILLIIMAQWADVNHSIMEKGKDAGDCCFVLPVMNHGRTGRCPGEASYHSHCQSRQGRIQAVLENPGLEQILGVTLLLRVSCPWTYRNELKL